MLAIEIDGSSHDHKKEADENRQKELESLGVRFIRFPDHEVKADMEQVLGYIEYWIENQEKQGHTPDPSQEGKEEEKL